MYMFMSVHWLQPSRLGLEAPRDCSWHILCCRRTPFQLPGQQLGGVQDLVGLAKKNIALGSTFKRPEPFSSKGTFVKSCTLVRYPRSGSNLKATLDPRYQHISTL